MIFEHTTLNGTIRIVHDGCKKTVIVDCQDGSSLILTTPTKVEKQSVSLHGETHVSVQLGIPTPEYTYPTIRIGE